MNPVLAMDTLSIVRHGEHLKVVVPVGLVIKMAALAISNGIGIANVID